MPIARPNTGCINHPGIESVARCRQCGKPVCGTCVVIGPLGKFCDESCRDRHAHFINNAQKQDLERGMRFGMITRVRRLVTKLFMYAIAIGGLGLVLTFFKILEIPLFRDILNRFQ